MPAHYLFFKSAPSFTHSSYSRETEVLSKSCEKIFMYFSDYFFPLINRSAYTSFGNHAMCYPLFQRKFRNCSQTRWSSLKNREGTAILMSCQKQRAKQIPWFAAVLYEVIFDSSALLVQFFQHVQHGLPPRRNKCYRMLFCHCRSSTAIFKE